MTAQETTIARWLFTWITILGLVVASWLVIAAVGAVVAGVAVVPAEPRPEAAGTM